MKDTFYFPHDYEASSDPKLTALVGEYKAEGYGVYWRIIEMLHSENEHKLQHKQYVYSAIAQQMKTDAQQIEDIINYCISVCELFASDGVFFYSKRVLRNINKRCEISEKRKIAGKKSAEKRIENKEVTASVEQDTASVEQNPTKEIKEKERKGNKNKKEFTPPTLFEVENYFCENGFDKVLAKTFFDGYSVNNWLDSNNKKITNWKQKAIHVWFKDKDKKQKTDSKKSVSEMSPAEIAAAQQKSYEEFYK